MRARRDTPGFLPLGRLTRRPQFLAVAAARRKFAAPGVIVQIRRHDAEQHAAPGEPTLRVGYTASRKVGNAVARNRAKRRLRAAAAEVVAGQAAPDHDVVLIAREETVRRPFADLVGDVSRALARLGALRPAEAS
jgi:ribonuclease P protein component